MLKRLIMLIILLYSLQIFSFEANFMSDPAISPDGKTVCFVYMKDLWKVSINGGDAKRLTNTDADEYSPVFSPDNKWIAFNSNRDGLSKIYIIPADGGLAKLVNDEAMTLQDWFNDGEHLLAIFDTPEDDAKYVKININSKSRSLISEYADIFANLSMDNRSIIFNKRGYPYREAYRGSHNGDLFLFDISKKDYQQLTTTDFTERYPIFSKNEKNKVYYVASVNDVFQIFKADLSNLSEPQQLTHFDQWSARDLSVSKDNETIVFELFNQIWKLDPKTKKTDQIKVLINEDCLSDYLRSEVNYNKLDNFSVSPNSKWIAFSYKYDLFASPLDGGNVKQLTTNNSGIGHICIANDNQNILYSTYVKGELKLFYLNINAPEKIKLVDWSKDKRIESITPVENNYYIQYSVADRRMRIAKLDSLYNYVSDVFEDQYIYDYAISKNGQWGAYITADPNSRARQLKISDFKKKEVFLITIYSGWMSSLLWDENNNSLYYATGNNLNRFDLIPLNEFVNKKDPWDSILKSSLNKEKKIKEKQENEISFNNAENRIVNIKTFSPNSWINTFFSSKDSTLYFFQNQQDKTILKKIKWDGSEESEIYTFNGNIQAISLSSDKNNVFYIDAKNLNKLSIKNKKTEQISFKHRYEYNELSLNKAVFEQVWAQFGFYFYDKNMHQKNWEDLYQKYISYADHFYSVDMLSTVIEELIGEVNASHTGYYPRSERRYQSKEIAYLGAEIDYSKSFDQGLLLKKVYDHSSLAINWNIKPNDVILAIDDIAINKDTVISNLLAYKIGEKIKLLIKTKEGEKTVFITGLRASQQNNLRYKHWVEERRRIVDQKTKGEIAYLHIKSMDQASLNQFKQDLFAKSYNKKALIIDVRDNGGGNIHDELVEILTRKQYAFTNSRYTDTAPRPFPNLTFEKPIVLLINENSFSDAEIFPVLFDHLKLGTIIGMPTSGSVIGTGSVDFMDGSSMRMPSNGWYTMSGVNMEGTGAKPHIMVPHTINDIINDHDQQLDRAIEELIKKIKK